MSLHFYCTKALNFFCRKLKPTEDTEVVSTAIAGRIRSSEPFALLRMGYTEAIISNIYVARQYSCNLIPYPSVVQKRAKPNSGIFPTQPAFLDQFAQIYLESLRSADYFAAWQVPGEAYWKRRYCQHTEIVDAHRILNPFLLQNPWTQALQNRRVLIIHAFTKTIEQQLRRRNEIFEDPRVLPDFESVILRPPQSLDQTYNQHESWKAALEAFLNDEVQGSEFDVALVSAGAYGVPITSFIKEHLKKPAIHMAGTMQLLFGILGKRWNEVLWLKPYINKAWVNPLSEDRIDSYLSTERGAYW